MRQMNINQENNQGCPECGGYLIYTNFEKICKECGLVIDIIFKNSSYSFKDSNNNNNLCKQYVALGDRTDYIGGLGSYIGYENSKYLRDKTGK